MLLEPLPLALLGPFLLHNRLTRRMLPNRKGAILFTGASASVKGYPQSAAFCDGKVRVARPRTKYGP